MNKAFFLRKEDSKPNWRVIDAQDKILGRLASEIVTILRGKDKAHFTPHTDCGDYVVVINAEKVYLSGDKWDIKEYARYTGWKSGLKITLAKDMKPEEMIELAVRRMLPKNKLADKLLAKLKVYTGTEHPHTAQNPQNFDIMIQMPSR